MKTRMEVWHIFVMICLILLPVSTAITQEKPLGGNVLKNDPSLAEYKLVWADEFNKEGKPDPRNWTYDIGFVRNKEA